MRWTFTLFLLLTLNAYGQSIDYWYHLTDGTRKPGKLIWLNYENDFFASTDRYYSQGISVYYKQTIKETSFARKLFLPLSHSYHQFGIGADHMAFTPTSIAFDTILEHDHPYAATIRGNVLFETVDTLHQRSFGWTLSAGIIGPEAKGKEMQTGIHKALENPRPKGWEHQLQTGLLLDLGAHAEQRLFHVRDWLMLSMQETGNLGTSRIDLTAGPRLQVLLRTKKDGFSFLMYFNPAIRFVGYDGTLQGSLIAQQSEYTVPETEVSHVIYEREFGAAMRWKHLSLNGVFQLQSPQYRTGFTHRWGGLRLNWWF